ncbi:MAG: ribosome biogenesis GTPase Der [Chlamydiae bacterium]|nr:ribosome biogenesis GTPase Der [Chlamydiota bacterium]MBI3266249.1 ribosome biogenesis GTPase Der [Chlamydiota bacterium]
MNSKNIVAIIGRPNVGKSTLFNRLIGRRISIVHEEPGITRDRVEARLTWNGISLRLVDTGGVDESQKDSIHRQVHEQVKMALEEAALVLLIVDAKNGVTPLDDEVAAWIRRSGKKMILVVNKVDHPNMEENTQEFYSFGFKSVFMISSIHGVGIAELLDEVTKHLGKIEEEEISSLKVAVVGKPNVGKSTLINFLLGKQRLIVDSVPGTTRDSIDVSIKIKNHLFTFVDTAGMRRRNQVKMGPETFSVMRSLKSIRRADLTVLMTDGAEGVTAQDIRILNEIRKRYKACVLVLNKWDLVKKVQKSEYTKALRERWKFLDIYPILFCSALTGFQIDNLIEKIVQVDESGRRKISDEELETFLENFLAIRQPPSEEGHMPRFDRILQAASHPPEFHIHVNQASFVKESYRFFLEREFRKLFGFEGSPIKFVYQSGKRKRSSP